MIIDELVDLDEERLITLEVLTKKKERVEKGQQQESKIKTFCSRRLSLEGYLANG